MFEMSALCSHTRVKTLMPLFDCVVDHVQVQSCPFLNDTLSQLVHILNFPAVNALVNNAAYSVGLSSCPSTVLTRDLRSFVIRFDFESYVRFEIRLY